MASNKPVVLVVDDDASMRSSISRFLGGAGYSVLTYPSIERLALTKRSDDACCLILDVELPEVSGLQFKEDLDRRGIRIPIIFITGVGDIPMGVHAMKRGAFDFLPKPFDVVELENAVARALQEDEKLLVQEREKRSLRAKFENLTSREREVFFGVAGGLLNKQVALRYGITEKTIKVHRSHVMEKMGADTFAALVRMADLLQFLSGRPHDALDAPVNEFYEDLSDLVCHTSKSRLSRFSETLTD